MPNPDERTLIQLRDDLAETLLSLSISSSFMMEQFLTDKRQFNNAREVLEASLEASALLEMIFHPEASNGFTLEDLRTVFCIGERAA